METGKIVEFGLLGGMVLSGVLGASSGGDMLGSMNDLREQNRTNTRQIEALRLSTQHQAELQEIAEQRFTEGCILVYNSEGDHLVSLQYQRPVIDRLTGVPLPPFSRVCDGLGNTAVIMPNDEGIPVADDFAFTGNHELVKHFVDTQAAGASRSFTQQEVSNGN